MNDLSTEYCNLAAEQETALKAEQSAREALEELDERRYRGDLSVSAAAVLAARKPGHLLRGVLPGLQCEGGGEGVRVNPSFRTGEPHPRAQGQGQKAWTARRGNRGVLALTLRPRVI